MENQSSNPVKEPASYEVPAQTRIGHIHLQVTDLEKALAFYRDILGFKVMQRFGNQVAFISAGGYHHHIGLNTWNSLGGPPARKQGAGLYHTAILYPTRSDLAQAIRQLAAANYPITGSADHGVSEAIYLDDPDGNGVELYWDRPQHQWPMAPDGSVQMYTRPMDMAGLLAEK
ncbi:VOC family protein [Hymenobacter sp. BT683]|uniref:VOC family protein n=1 Tax=Hymenobacter jeongseonensis TaxID=2791027 RepID=A0ABS0IHV4_9BACT|nr:VOC family protein [Hymenobacter jeongseonensis]MBF9237945.1 VOC family protein [Hymenobacter jeongseonensis]